MLSVLAMQRALVLSIAVHAAVLAGARPIASHLLAPPPGPSADEPDRWAGTSIEVSVGTSELAGSSGDAPAFSNTQSAPTSVSAPATPPQGVPSTTAVAPTATSPTAAAPTATAPATTSSAASAAATGKATAAPPPRKPGPARDARQSPPRAKRSKGEPSSTGGGKAGEAREPTSGEASAGSGKAGEAREPTSGEASAGSGSGAGGKTGTFGSEGPASVRDLGRAFTRAIPAACAADPVWAGLSPGGAGSLRVKLRVDAEGHLSGFETVGEHPPKHLVNVVRRTLPLLQAGTFAVRGGAVSAGTQTLELTATVSDEPSADGAGAQDNLAFSYEGGRGKASFTQTSGRRVDVSVRVVAVDVAE